jgi:hypothetical protein
LAKFTVKILPETERGRIIVGAAGQLRATSNEEDYHEKACARIGSGLRYGVHRRIGVGVSRQQWIDRRSRHSEHGAGRSVLSSRRLLVPWPYQRLLPGRLGLRFDHLLSFGDPQQRRGAQQQGPGPLIATDIVRRIGRKLDVVMMPVVEPAVQPVSAMGIRFLGRLQWLRFRCLESALSVRLPGHSVCNIMPLSGWASVLAASGAERRAARRENRS